MAATLGLKLVGRFLGNAVSESFAFAAGVAIGPVLGPPTQALRNTVNAAYPEVPIAPGLLAEGVAQGQIPHDIAATIASHSGISLDNFNHMIDIANVGPGSGYAFELWRRGDIDEQGFRRAVQRLGLEQEWIDDLVKLHDVLLTPAELANARQQGFVDQARQYSEAALQGVTNDRAEIQFELSGLPPGVDVLQRAANRNLIDQATFVQGIREGHTKTKYTDLLWTLRNPLLSAATAVRLYLKGWYTQAQRDALGAQWGYTPQQMEDWYLSEGRPATVHQIHIGYARGAKLAGAANEEDAILTSVKQSDIRPEYGPLLYAQRYTYPSAFVLRALVEGGAVTQAEGEQALLFSGWEPTFAAKVAASWAGTTTGTTADTHVSKAQTQIWTTTHASYKAYEISAAAATTALEKAGVEAATIPAVLDIWNAERALIRARLTASDVCKAYQKQDQNPATGAAWTRPDAVAQLLQLGYSNEDAEAFLNVG